MTPHATLVDTCVWIDHIRAGHASLGSLLSRGRVVTHPFVIGELAAGSIRNRRVVLQSVNSLPRLEPASHDDAMGVVESAALAGRGLTWVDIHLLVAAKLAGVSLLTVDRAMAAAASRLSVSVV